MYNERMLILERPKSKWPYWILYTNKEFNEYSHWLTANRLRSEKIPVVCEKQWGKFTMFNGRKSKRQIGMLYKFRKEEDRLLFLMEYNI